MNLRRRVRWVTSCILLAFAGCDGVGRALVDRKLNNDARADEPDCPNVPECSDGPELEEISDLPLVRAAIDLADCGLLNANCANDGLTLDGAPQSHCDQTFTTSERETRWLSPDGYRCSAMTIDVDDAREEIRLTGLSLEHSNLRVHARRPVRVILEDASLVNAWIGIDGPATVKIQTSTLNDVGVSLEQPESVAVLEESFAQTLFLGTTLATATERVELVRSRVDRGQIQAGDLRITSSRLDAVDLTTSSATILDTTASNGRWTIHGIIAASRLDHLRLGDCGDLTIAGSTVALSVLSACPEGITRVYDTLLEDSVLDGPVQADGAKLSSVSVGVSEPTNLDAWNTWATFTRFCRNSRSIRFGGDDVHLACTYCDERSPDEPTCQAAGSVLELDLNASKAFEAPPNCPKPGLVRARPADL